MAGGGRAAVRVVVDHQAVGWAVSMAEWVAVARGVGKAVALRVATKGVMSVV